MGPSTFHLERFNLLPILLPSASAVFKFEGHSCSLLNYIENKTRTKPSQTPFFSLNHSNNQFAYGFMSSYSHYVTSLITLSISLNVIF